MLKINRFLNFFDEFFNKIFNILLNPRFFDFFLTNIFSEYFEITRGGVFGRKVVSKLHTVVYFDGICGSELRTVVYFDENVTQNYAHGGVFWQKCGVALYYARWYILSKLSLKVFYKKN